MLPAASIIVENLALVLSKHQMKPAHFSDMAESQGLGITRPFISRLMSGASMNITIQKLEALSVAVAILEPDMTVADLLTPNSMKDAKKPFCFNELKAAILKSVLELEELKWLKVDDSVPSKLVSDYISMDILKNYIMDRKAPIHMINKN